MVDNRLISEQFREWVIARRDPPSISHVVFSAFAAVTSYAIARLFHLPEAYWAPMSALIVTQLTLRAAFPIAVQYVVGTAIGAAVGGLADIYFHTNVWALGAAIVLVGLLCVALHIERSAFRYANITLVIVTLVPRSASGGSVALRRFFEVSIGIGVGLVLFAAWQKIDLKFPAKVSPASSIS
ncbi:MAG: FUSC family protein [Acidobacteriaceae bacterium]|nr:FUSC family protein [Acidobacteriaceae bacterium]